MNSAIAKSIARLNAGEIDAARRILRAEAMDENPDNAAAWALLAILAKTPLQKAHHLNRVLQLQPDHQWAQDELREVEHALKRASSKNKSEFQVGLGHHHLKPPGFRAEAVFLPWLQPGFYEPAQTGLRGALTGLISVALSVALIASMALLLAPRVLGSNLLVVLSQSMEPKVPMGAAVISEPVSVSEIQIGDVVTYQTFEEFGEQALITHRVIDIDDQGLEILFTTKGDAAEEPDINPVPASAILGEVRFTLPLVGFVLAAIRSPVGFAIIIGIPALFIILDELRNIAEILRSSNHQAARDRTSEFVGVGL